jgi:primosomal protein N' (replication factor Y)
MPPYTHQALLRAEARQLGDALAFLDAARTAGLQWAADRITLYPPVPMAMQKVANAERAQMLIESAHRGALQQFLNTWSDALHATRTQHKRVTRWAIDIDPQAI